MRQGIDWKAYFEMAKGVKAESADPTEPEEILDSEILAPEILSLYETGYRKGVRTGWGSMDQFFSVRPGEFTVITGYPGGGKSTWLDNLMINIARADNWKWAVFSAENYPVSRHIASLAEIYLGKPFNRGCTERMSKRELTDALGWMQSHFSFIQPREDRFSLDRIIHIACSIGDANALVIDPWNELDHSRPREMREDEFISISLTKLRWFARNSSLHVFVVAHPAKYIREAGKPKPVATLNEVKGASEWFAKADNGLSVWRNELDDAQPSEVYVQKIRFREVGRIGKVEFRYDRVTGRFSEASPIFRAEDRPKAKSAGPISWFEPGASDVEEL